MKKILIVGAGGQIGSELVPHLRAIYGADNVVAADISADKCKVLAEAGPFEELNALDGQKYAEIVRKYKVDTIFNMVALLSATGEKNPQLAWDVNIGALTNSLNIAKDNNCAVFTPSSIGAFGKDTPKNNTPQDTLQRSTSTMYGVCKVTGELLSDYYFNRFGVDTRSVRFPGLISYVTLPGGGTTDYAVEIYYDAVRKGEFTCNIAAGTYMDMMYMPDALNGVVELMEADPAKLIHRNSFNIAAMSFDPEGIAAEIRKHIPEFKMSYDVDPIKQAIADSWPNSMDDSCARNEWGWTPKYDLSSMTTDMLLKIREKLDRGEI
ncbi:MAG: NAD-dependent epimerase/dehydratase family protein [Marinifilaceae bacterium]